MNGMNPILEKAQALRESKSKSDQAYQKKLDKQYKESQATLIEEFEIGFVQVLDMLKESGVSYSAHYQDPRYEHMGTYIQFEKEGLPPLKMDFNNRRSYRYEYVQYSTDRYGTMTYGNWDMDKFILFLAEWMEGFEGWLKEIEESKDYQ